MLGAGALVALGFDLVPEGLDLLPCSSEESDSGHWVGENQGFFECLAGQQVPETWYSRSGRG